MRTPEFLVALATWSVWLLYWIGSARDSKPAVYRESDRSRRGQSVFMIGGGILIGLPDLGAHAFDRHIELIDRHWTIAPGLTCIAVGLAFTVWARRCLAGNWSVSVTLKAEHELVSRGPYRLVRHPIYSGALLALCGTVLAGDQWRGLIGLAMVLGALWFKMRLEDRLLSIHFGDAYAKYRWRVPALMPGMRVHR